MEYKRNPWFVCPQRRPMAEVRLFCFTYAGGGASIFYAWAKGLPPEIETCIIQLPGRERRLAEQPFTNMQLLIHVLSENFAPYLDMPFTFFGHSMGALVGFELACMLRQWYGVQPRHLFSSAHRAPQLPDHRDHIHHLSASEFVEKLRKFNGTPEKILQNDEFMELILPVLRADFTLCETYSYAPRAPLDCALTALGGTHDTMVNSDELSAWQAQTTGTFAFHLLPGDHFYLHGERLALLDIISAGSMRSSLRS
ncbi:MAG: thioesterase II family protein [Ktedonobacteraceae bacterium]